MMPYQDKKDAAISATCPVVGAPTHGQLVDLVSGQRRYIVATDGLYIEARSDVLHVCQRIEAFEADTVTWAGAVKPFIRVLCRPVPRKLFADLIDRAEAATPTEMAALVVAGESGWEIHDPGVQSASATHVTYGDLTLEQEPLLLIDAHSHGEGRAYFSQTDDASDRGRQGPHISVVFGRCHADIRYVSRLCVGQHLITLTQPLDSLGVVI